MALVVQLFLFFSMKNISVADVLRETIFFSFAPNSGFSIERLPAKPLVLRLVGSARGIHVNAPQERKKSHPPPPPSVPLLLPSLTPSAFLFSHFQKSLLLLDVDAHPFPLPFLFSSLRLSCRVSSLLP
jgi:hypothetical protein